MTAQPGSALDWEGRTIRDRAGEKIGRIEDIFLVEETGRPEWALVKLGRVRGGATLVPLTGAGVAGGDVRAGVEKRVVDEAPRLAAERDPSDQQVEALYRHYGVDGAQEQTATHEAPAQRTPPPPSASHDARSTGATLKRTVAEFSDDNLTHWAAALTYYGVLSIFPALLAVVSILGLIGSSAIQPLLDNVGDVAPGPAKDILTSSLEGLQSSGGAGLLFVVALAGAIWSASGYISAFMDASNAIYDTEEGRGFLKRLPLRLGVTVLMLVLLSVSAVAVVLTGPLAREVGNVVGVGDGAVTVWNIAKWPVLVVVVAFMFAVLYFVSPNVKQPGLTSVLPGGLLAVVLWIVVSALFAVYVASFGSYNKTYGALGGVIVFMVWLWLTNLAILLGAEFNAERARGRYIEAGHRADEEPYLPVKEPAGA
jgi:membrane protein